MIIFVITEVLIGASKEVGLGVNAEETVSAPEWRKKS
jgi:hypothetical protein